MPRGQNTSAKPNNMSISSTTFDVSAPCIGLQHVNRTVTVSDHNELITHRSVVSAGHRSTMIKHIDLDAFWYTVLRSRLMMSGSIHRPISTLSAGTSCRRRRRRRNFYLFGRFNFYRIETSEPNVNKKACHRRENRAMPL